jgi:hypothetical protein
MMTVFISSVEVSNDPTQRPPLSRVPTWTRNVLAAPEAMMRRSTIPSATVVQACPLTRRSLVIQADRLLRPHLRHQLHRGSLDTWATVVRHSTTRYIEARATGPRHRYRDLQLSGRIRRSGRVRARSGGICSSRCILVVNEFDEPPPIIPQATC